MPIVAKVLPYINGLVIALQRLFGWIAKLLHIDLSGLTSGKSGGGVDNDALSGLADDADSLADGLDDAGGKAKKLKHQLMGFDELNVITTPDDSSGKMKGLGGLGGLLDDAFGDAVDDYLKAWEDAFSKIQNRAEEIADKIAKFFKRLFTPLFEAWRKYGDRIVEDWKTAFKSIGKLGESIGRDFWRVWESTNTQKIFDNSLLIIDDIGVTIGTLADKIREAWDYNDNGYKILSAIRDIVLVIVKTIRRITKSTKEWAQNLDLKPLFSTIATLMQDLVPVVDTLYSIFADFYEQVLLPLSKWALEKGLPELGDVLDRLLNEIHWEDLRDMLSELWKHLEPFAERVGEGLILFIEDVGEKLKNFINDGGLEKFLNGIEDWMDRTSAEDIKDTLWAITNGLIGLKVAVVAWSGIKGISEIVKVLSVFSKLGKGGALAKLGANIGKLGGKLGSGVQALLFGAGAKGALGSLGGLLGANTIDLGTVFGAGTGAEIGTVLGLGIGEAVVTAIAGLNIGNKIGELLFPDTSEMREQYKGVVGAFRMMWDFDVALFDSIIMAFEKLGDVAETVGEKIGKVWTDSNKAVEDWFTTSVAPWFTEEKWIELGEGMKLGIETKWYEFTEWWNSTALVTWWNENVVPYFSYEKWVEQANNIKKGIQDKWNEFTTWWNQQGVVKWFNEKVAPNFTKEKWTFNGIKDGLKQAWEDAIKLIKNIWNSFAESFNAHSTIDIPAVTIGGKKITDATSFSFGKLPTFANGGFPEDGFFFANHNELVGGFSNGKTAVANNDQIIAGIEQGVYNAVVSALANNNSNTNVNVTLAGDADGIFRVVRSSAKSYQKANGVNAFSF